MAKQFRKWEPVRVTVESRRILPDQVKIQPQGWGEGRIGIGEGVREKS